MVQNDGGMIEFENCQLFEGPQRAVCECGREGDGIRLENGNERGRVQ